MVLNVHQLAGFVFFWENGILLSRTWREAGRQWRRSLYILLLMLCPGKRTSLSAPNSHTKTPSGSTAPRTTSGQVQSIAILTTVASSGFLSIELTVRPSSIICQSQLLLSLLVSSLSIYCSLVFVLVLFGLPAATPILPPARQLPRTTSRHSQAGRN